MTLGPICAFCIEPPQACRCPNGEAFDLSKTVSAWIRIVARDASETGVGGNHWSYTVVSTLTRDFPSIGWDFIEAAADAVSTPYEASMLAAGPLEDLIADNGREIIDRIEAKAANSARFRCILSGVWTRGEDPQGEVWQRVCWAREPGPHLDDGLLPPADP